MKATKPHNLIAYVIAALGIGFVLAYGISNISFNRPVVAACENSCVELGESAAKPNTLTVTKGSFVQFNAADGKSHNLSTGEGGEEHMHIGKLRSGEFSANEAWRVQFNEEGSFYFHDHLNPKINVLVVVYEPGKNYTVN